jgi:hypothetical protein
MPAILPWIERQISDAAGLPISGAKIYPFAANTTTPKVTYQDALGLTPNTHPIVTDAAGRFKCFMDTGSYDFQVKDAADVLQYTLEDLSGDNAGGNVTLGVVATIADLKALSGGAFGTVQVTGYWIAGDGGGGIFRWDSSNSGAENGGTLLLPNSAPAVGRWVRIYSGALNLKWFGAKGDGSDDYSAIVQALGVAKGFGGTVIIPNQSFSFSASITLDSTYNGISLLGLGLFNSELHYTGAGDGLVLGGNINGVTLADFRLTSLTGRDAISIQSGVASATPDAGVLRFARLDIRQWLRHAIKGRLTVNFNTEQLSVVLNGGCGLYIENANPYRATTFSDKASWFHQNGGHGIVLKGTFTHTFTGTISDSNTGLSTDPDTISSAGYTLIGGGTWTGCVSTDIGKSVTQGGAIVGTLAHYDNIHQHMVINCTTPPNGAGALAVVSATGAGVDLYLDAAGYVNAIAGDVGKTVLRNGINVGALTAYDNVLRKWTINVTTAIAGGGAMTISTGTGAGTSSGGSTTSTFRKNNHGFYAARSAYINITGGHFENHLYGIFLDSVYDSVIAQGYILTQGAGAFGFYAAGVCQRVQVPMLGVDVQAGGTAAAYRGPLCIGVNWNRPGAYATVDRSANSFSTDTQNAGSTLVTLSSTGADPFNSGTTDKRVGIFSGSDSVESILSVNNGGGASGRPTFAWRKDDTVLARAFADNNLNSFVFKVGSNAFVHTNGTLEDVIQANDANKFYLPMQGLSGPVVLELSNGAAEGLVSLGRWDGVARLNNGEVRAVIIEHNAIGAVANERGGQVAISTRTSGAAGASVVRAILDENGLVLSIRIQHKRGANVASANDLTLGLDGNSFGITGATAINGIATANWQSGSVVKLFLLGAITVKHNTAPSAGFAKFALQGAADFVGASGAVLTVEFDGTLWQEISRRTA